MILLMFNNQDDNRGLVDAWIPELDSGEYLLPNVVYHYLYTSLDDCIRK